MADSLTQSPLLLLHADLLSLVLRNLPLTSLLACRRVCQRLLYVVDKAHDVWKALLSDYRWNSTLETYARGFSFAFYRLVFAYAKDAKYFPTRPPPIDLRKPMTPFRYGIMALLSPTWSTFCYYTSQSAPDYMALNSWLVQYRRASYTYQSTMHLLLSLCTVALPLYGFFAPHSWPVHIGVLFSVGVIDALRRGIYWTIQVRPGGAPYERWNSTMGKVHWVALAFIFFQMARSLTVPRCISFAVCFAVITLYTTIFRRVLGKSRLRRNLVYSLVPTQGTTIPICMAGAALGEWLVGRYRRPYAEMILGHK